MWTTESCKTSTMLQKYNDYSDVIGIVRAQQEGHTLSKFLTGLITLRLVEGDVLWRVSEDDVNCGSIEVCEWLLKNTVDSSSKVSTFVNSSTSKWYLSNFRSRLALLICFTDFKGVVRDSAKRRAMSIFTWLLSSLSASLVLLHCTEGLQGVVRSSDLRRLLSFFPCHCCKRCRLRAFAAGLLLFLFCTAADRLTFSFSSSSSHGLHTGVEGAATTGVGAGNPAKF